MKKRRGVLPWISVQHFKRGKPTHSDYCINPKIVFFPSACKPKLLLQYSKYQVSKIVSLNVKIKDVGE